VEGVIAPLMQAERFSVKEGHSSPRVELPKARYLGLNIARDSADSLSSTLTPQQVEKLFE
jgi:hypothetical protein